MFSLNSCFVRPYTTVASPNRCPTSHVHLQSQRPLSHSCTFTCSLLIYSLQSSKLINRHSKTQADQLFTEHINSLCLSSRDFLHITENSAWCVSNDKCSKQEYREASLQQKKKKTTKRHPPCKWQCKKTEKANENGNVFWRESQQYFVMQIQETVGTSLHWNDISFLHPTPTYPIPVQKQKIQGPEWQICSIYFLPTIW